ncbi:MAG: chromosomal replication initiator protein DnaA [Candidatus Omnitrophica bacterium]|nr:chromosomal replication initiator protein DnaA [Candidatus Omnitrophota bacterium]
MENFWEKVSSILRSEVNDQVFAAWFDPLTFISKTDNSVVIGVPNKFFENWMREKYSGLIKTAAEQIAGNSLSVEFQIVAPSKEEKSSPSAGEVPSSFQALEAKKRSPEPLVDDKEHPGGWLRSVFGGARVAPEVKAEAKAGNIGLNPCYTFENFVVGQSNRFAHAASLAVSEKLSKIYNPLFLYGGVGLGKTHLMQALGHEILKTHPKAKVLYISSEEFTNQLITAIRTRTTPKFRSMYRNVDVLLIDDIQFIAGKESTQEEFFHTFNALHDAHKQIVLCSDRSPREIKSLEERLISRFAWGLIADIQLPDFETRIAIMEKKGESTSQKVSKEVLYFLGENIKTNIREMEGAFIRVVAYAKLTGGEVSVSLAKEVLKDMISQEEKKISIDLIQKTVSSFFNITKENMLTKRRTRAVAYPRQVAMFLSREMTDHSLPDIGTFFGGRDHTTVLHACDKIGNEVNKEEKTQVLVKKLRELITG